MPVQDFLSARRNSTLNVRFRACAIGAIALQLGAYSGLPSGTYSCSGDTFKFSGSTVTGNIAGGVQQFPIRTQGEDIQVQLNPTAWIGMFTQKSGKLYHVEVGLDECKKQ